MPLRYSLPLSGGKVTWRRLDFRGAAITFVALALVGFLMIAAALVLEGRFAQPSAPMPFSIGLRETTPTGTLGAILLSYQSWFYQSIIASLKRIAETRGGIGALFTLCFAYGVFHAAGPGHGKALIAGYVFADGRSTSRGILLSIGAAFTQTLVAVGIISIFAIALHGTAASVTGASAKIEAASFVVVALVGLRMTWSKSASLAQKIETGHAFDVLALPIRRADTSHDKAPYRLARSPLCGCGHNHIFTAEQITEASFGWRETTGLMLAAGLRPCTGVIVLLVFALSQHLYGVGVLAAFVVAVGTATTTSAVAFLASMSKQLLKRTWSVRGNGTLGRTLFAGSEILVGAVLFWLGVTLVAGSWSSVGS